MFLDTLIAALVEAKFSQEDLQLAPLKVSSVDFSVKILSVGLGKLDRYLNMKSKCDQDRRPDSRRSNQR